MYSSLDVPLRYVESQHGPPDSVQPNQHSGSGLTSFPEHCIRLARTKAMMLAVFRQYPVNDTKS